MRQRRHGFTLIELLVVIGIMLVLIGLLIMGFRHVSATAARKETDAELHIARGMLTEYENHNGLQNIEAYTTSPAKDTTATPTRIVPVYCDPAASINSTTNTLTWPYLRVPTDTATMWTGEPAQSSPQFSTSSQFDLADSSSSTDMSNRTSTGARYTGAAVQRTRDVMLFLIRVPANRNLIETVQSKRILEGSTATMDAQGPVLLDGWGNPILFVPRGGIHVFMPDLPASGTNPNSEYVVRTTGIFPAPNSVGPALTGAERPFFASAGQDGDFTLGEDNVYSFQE